MKVGDRRYRESWGLYYEEFTVGDVIEHRPGRTVTETDNIWQSLLCMNTSPLHIDSAYCETTEWGRPLMSSLVTFSIVNGMTVSSLTARGIANLGWDKVRLPNPCFAGDTIYAESTVLSKRLSQSRSGQGVVTCETRGLKADGTVILTCERTFLVPTREHAVQREAPHGA
ncbi:MAG TPA: MaoC family dehydratase [Thermoanaerobaculia bacterium]|nr:MaoC family dehydratase [Thermoanaerobaculia bacterium]